MTPPPRLAALCLLLVACRSPAPRPVTVVAAPVDVPAAPADPDDDGVTGEADRCPEAPEDCDGTDDADGCPDPDDDGDGVPDVCDACPRDRGQAPDGCDHRVVLEDHLIQIIPRVFFEANRAALSPRSLRLLSAIVDILRAYPVVRRLEVQGHASAGERDPRRVSQQRADAVLAWLTAHGVEAERLVAHAYSVDAPVDPNATPQGRARNRRVEFRLLEVDQPQQPPPVPRRVVPDGCPDHPPPPRRGPCTGA